jgi:hypothetical protein
MSTGRARRPAEPAWGRPSLATCGPGNWGLPCVSLSLGFSLLGDYEALEVHPTELQGRGIDQEGTEGVGNLLMPDLLPGEGRQEGLFEEPARDGLAGSA